MRQSSPAACVREVKREEGTARRETQVGIVEVVIGYL